MLVFLILIVVIVYLVRSNSDLNNENSELKKRLSNIDNFCPNCGWALNKNIINNNFNSQVNYNNQINNNIVVNNYNQVIDKEKSKLNSKEIKNSLILISGSILIILSAIIFLTSTWSVTHNFFKTIIIILMLGIFLAAEFIAEKFFKLKETSRAFYYIALAYIPIIFLSIALFELFGKYLSLYGLGRYIYLTFSSLIVSGIYYYNAIKRDNDIIAIFSMIFCLLGFTFLSLIFNSTSFYLVMIILFIYNLLLMIGYKNKKFYYKESFHLKVINILTISLSVVSIFGLMSDLIFDVVAEDIILEILLLINLYYCLIKVNNKENIYNYIYGGVVVLIFYTLARLISDDYIVKQLLILISFAFIYLYEYLRKNELSNISYFEILGIVIILSLGTFINIDIINYFRDITILGLKSYYILGFFFILNIINYFITNKYKLVQAIILTVVLILGIFSFTINEMPQLLGILVGYLALVLIFIELFISKLDYNFKLSFKWGGHITLWICTLLNIFNGNTLALIILYFIYMLLSFYDGIKRECDYFRIISYIYFNIVINYFCSLLGLNITYIVPFTTILITIFEYFKPKLKTNISNIYIIISFVISFLILLDVSILNFILLIIMAVMFMIYICYYKKSDNYLYIPTLLFIPYIYDSNILYFNGFNYMYLISVLSLLLIAGLIYYKGKNFYIILFYIYVFFHLSCLEEIKYIGIILLLIGTFASYLSKDNVVKDIFKFILYLCLFKLYGFIIEDLNLINLTILTVGSYLVLLLISTRTILNKYSISYKVWEYLGSSLINLIAIITYTSEMDGIIYVMVLTLLVIISYIYKYGPIFIVCLISILLNVFILTRTFWFSIPWWLYILLVGSILIAFAIYNEIREKNNQQVVKNKLETFKNNLDL